MTEKHEPLHLTKEAMRSMGYAVIDTLVDYHGSKREWTVSRVPDYETLTAQMSDDFPETGRPVDDVLSVFHDVIAPNISHVDHPRFFGFVPGPGNYVSTLAETLTSGFNIFAGTWLGGASAALVEKITIAWLARSCGFPADSGGLFVSGGSMANLTALAVARYAKLDGDIERGVAYCSDQTHTAVDRALRVLGLRPEHVRRIPSDDQFHMDMLALSTAIQDDREAGLHPFCVVGNAGTTNTGAIDPLEKLGTFCRSEDLWFHIDGAYGAAAVISEKGRIRLGGLETADSIALDPHKWLFQTFETGCVLVRDARLHRAAFKIMPEYMLDTERVAQEINYCDYGIQLSRSFRSFKLWMTLQVFGTQALSDAVAHGIELAEWTEERIREMGNWVVASSAVLGIVTMRFSHRDLAVDAADRVTREAATMLRESGLGMVSTTTIDDRAVIRMCTINPEANQEDVDTVLRALDHHATKLVDNLSFQEGNVDVD